MKNLTIFCLPLSGLGHMNACVGLCTALQRRGHKVVFGVENSWSGTLKERGFEEEVYEEQKTSEEESGAQHSKFFSQLSPILRKSFKEHLTFGRLGYMMLIERMKYCDNRIQGIIETVKPDVIIVDHYISYPSVVKSNIPTILFHSANPLVSLQNQPILPPTGFGLPLDDRTDWETCRQMRRESMQQVQNFVNEWFLKEGLPSLPPHKFEYEASLNILLYPKALFDGYAKLINLSDNYILLEHTISKSVESFNLPVKFYEKPGKLVYISMGSMGSSDIELMIRLTKMLSKSKHKFVVAKGHSHDKYELYENQWGQPFVDQLQILQICDLFITHGGNNSVTEAFYFGKPMIICPLFGDQYNNAQRVSELNLGVRLNPFTVEESELLSTIDNMLSDTVLYGKLQVIAKDIQNSNSMENVVKRIELIADTKLS